MFFQTQLQICANVPFIPMRLKEVMSSLVIPSLSVNNILRVTLPQWAMVLRHNWPNQTKGKCAHIILGTTLSLAALLEAKRNPLGTNTFCKVFKHHKDLRGSQYWGQKNEKAIRTRHSDDIIMPLFHSAPGDCPAWHSFMQESFFCSQHYFAVKESEVQRMVI